MGKIYAFIILSVCLIMTIRSADSKMSKPISFFCSFALLAAAMPYAAKIIHMIKNTGQTNISTLLYIPVIIICGEMLSALCADIGEKALSESIVFVTRIILVGSMTEALSGVVEVIGRILK